MFSVAVLAKEEPNIIKALLDHYEEIGAEEFFLFFDGRNCDVRSFVSRRRGPMKIHFFELESNFWIDHLGHVPLDFQIKQNVIYRHAVEHNSSEWIFLCDADEFVIERTSIRDALKSVPSCVESVSIPSAEACWVEGMNEDFDKVFSSTHFRRPIKIWPWRMQRNFLYGHFSPFFQFNLLGHTVGKQFVRRGIRYTKITSHFSYRNDQKITVPLWRFSQCACGIELAHFDAISFPRWLEKFRRRVDGETIQGRTKSRNMQKFEVEKIRDLNGSNWEIEAKRFFKALYVLDKFQYTMLRSQGACFSYHF